MASAADNVTKTRSNRIVLTPKLSKGDTDNKSATSRRENVTVIRRQPSYCKILDDLKEAENEVAGVAENEVSKMKKEVVEKPGQPEGVDAEVVETEEVAADQSSQPVQTITINGQQYQIVSPNSEGAIQASSTSGTGVVQYAATSQNGQTVFIPGTVAAASSSGPQIISVGSAGTSTIVGGGYEDVSRKREIRLLKNREAARECRNKKKEYIKCLENRVAILENQNKALIEELKSLKELYAKS